jgi:holo-[acyl-carrier protein] synthase
MSAHSSDEEAAPQSARPRIVLGVDLLENARLLDLHQRYGERLLRRLFTVTELEQAGWRAERLVSRFAAKEAAGKALGTGMVTVAWREIEVLRTAGGKPALRLHGRAAARAALLGIEEFDVSISDTHTHTVAVVVGVCGA